MHTETDEQRRADAIAWRLWRRGEQGDPYQVDAGVPGDAMTEAPARREREEGESER